jgi:chemotaxis protein methyltransferase CheR
MNTLSTNLPEIGVLVSQVADKLGLSLSESRQEAAASAITRVMAQRGIGEAKLLLDQVGANQDLTDDLVNAVTVGETYFFRGQSQFDLISNTLLADLRRPAGSPIRIWSAGCATGEEPYSLAILCEESGMSDDVRIAASDISRKAVAGAMNAEYSEWSLRNTDEYLKERYFFRHRARYRLTSDLARRVSFTCFSLGADELPAPEIGLADFDLILCRNVLVYLHATAVQRIACQLFACLARGGWLLTAPADPPLWKHVPFETSITSAGVVYRRPLKASQPADRDRAAPISPDLRRPTRPLSVLPTEPKRLDRAQNPASEDRATSIVGEIRTLLGRGDSDRAGRMAAEAIKDQPLSAELHYLQGLCFLSERSTELAAASLRRVVYIDGTLAAAQFLLGLCLKDSDPRAALHAFESALSLCISLPPQAPVSLMPGEVAGNLAARARRERADLWRHLEARDQ